MAFSSAVLPVFNVGSVFGRCIPGHFADKNKSFSYTICYFSYENLEPESYLSSRDDAFVLVSGRGRRL
jgi:hypothetical protein